MEQTADNFDLAAVESDLLATSKRNDKALTDEALAELNPFGG